MKAPTMPLELLSAQAIETQATTTDAVSEGGASEAQPSLFNSMLFPIAACFLVFWFIVIRPEKRQRKAREQMLGALKKGDDVLTSGGIYGSVAQVRDDVVTVQVADGVRLRFSLSSVQSKTNDDEPAKVSEADTPADSSGSE